MKALPGSTREVARRLLALEAARGASSQPNEALRVCEKLRVSLTRFAGADGFTALLRRALGQARNHYPAIEAVKVGQDGQLNGFEKLFADASSSGTDATVEIIAALLALLVTFVGASLTQCLLREAWPELSQEEWKQIEAL